MPPETAPVRDCVIAVDRVYYRTTQQMSLRLIADLKEGGTPAFERRFIDGVASKHIVPAADITIPPRAHIAFDTTALRPAGLRQALNGPALEP